MLIRACHFSCRWPAPQPERDIRIALFSITDIAIFVVFVFNVGVWTGLPPYLWLSAAVGSAYGLPVLYRYFDVESELNARYNSDVVNQVCWTCGGLLWRHMSPSMRISAVPSLTLYK